MEQKYVNNLELYARFHRHRVNLILHAICVPLELLSMLVICSAINVTIAYLATIILVFGAIATKSQFAKIVIASHVIITFISCIIFNWLGPSSAVWMYAFVLQLITWIVQVRS